MKKLYKVTIEMMVIADNEDEAESIASGADMTGCDFEIEEATECLPGWEDAFPFGDNDDGVRCGDLVKNEGRKRVE